MTEDLIFNSTEYYTMCKWFRTLYVDSLRMDWLVQKVMDNTTCASWNISISSFNYIRLYLTNRFQVAVRLFSNRSQMTSKFGKNKKVAHEVQPSVSLMFLPHFDVLCDLLLNRHTATWNLFVLYNKELKNVLMMTSIRLSSYRS